MKEISITENIPHCVLDAYEHLGMPVKISPIEIGLINKTYVITTPKDSFILQELSPIFKTAVIDDSHAVAHHLISHGITAPKHLLTATNELFVKTSGRIFRALHYIAGMTSNSVRSLPMAASAGHILGQFHRALLDFHYEYRNKRHHGGDYPYHTSILVNALTRHQDHEYFDRVELEAVKMIRLMEEITGDLTTTPRHVHGDPKISNIIFDDKEKALCLVDFDTLGETGWSLELADALRSWCNPNAEDVPDAFVDLAIAEHALQGYGSVMKGQLSDKEANELIIHVQAITLCLSMRYLADVLNETYWAFDQKRFSRAADHNWLRAKAMFSLFSDFQSKETALFDMIRSLLY